MRITTISFLCLVFVAGSAMAQQRPEKLEPLPEIPPPPAKAIPDSEDLEPAIRIRRQRGDRIEEYKQRGRTVAVRVTPASGGPSYLLVDRQGTGRFSIVPPATVSEFVIPSWTVYEW
jgi:hypothetical protein